LVVEGRVAEAIEYAGQKLADGDESAAAWLPRIQAADRNQISQIQYFLTLRADEALPDLLTNTEDSRTKLWMADVDWAAYGDLQVRRTEPGRAEIALACWHVYTDTARYFGDNPPNDRGTRADRRHRQRPGRPVERGRRTAGAPQRIPPGDHRPGAHGIVGART
jgi:hypothetical protein